MSSDHLFHDSQLPWELDQRVQSELREGEKLLWVGQPLPRRFIRSSIPIVLFGIPWTAFALFWMAGASGILFAGAGNNGPAGGFFGLFACFPLFGLPFVIIGFGMLSSPYWMWRQAKRTCYALTDRRAIVWEAGAFRSVEIRSFGPAELTRISRKEFPDGSGDLVFEEYMTVGSDSNGHRTTSTKRRGFMSIADVKQIEELVRRALLPDSV